MNKIEVGKRYGTMVIIEDKRYIKKGNAYVKVKCDCGNITIKNLSRLKRNISTKCSLQCPIFLEKKRSKFKIGDRH